MIIEKARALQERFPDKAITQIQMQGSKKLAA